ncbi:hypothetical protein Neosp_002024 [[Neocosmospora] mangrovei]
MHGVLNRLFDSRLIFPPIRSPRRILDCGCGPGDWAMEVASQYPDAEVTDRNRQVLGIDISPHVIPENPPDNMELQVDDLNGRPRSITVVKAVSAEPTAVQRPSGTIADGNMDEECGVYRSRIEVVDLADVCLVEW